MNARSLRSLAPAALLVAAAALALSLGAQAPVRSPGTRGAAAAGQPDTEASLRRILAEYQRPGQSRSIEALVRLDREIRTAMQAFREARYEAGSSDATRIRGDFSEIGVNGNAFDPDLIEYSGRLLADAHALNPVSPWRSSTFYATTFTTMPDTADPLTLKAVRAYQREFPRGPFAPDVTLTLAHFYDDLYKMVRDSMKGAGQMVDYKIGCIVPYFTRAPLRDQMRAARDSAIRYYDRAVAMRPGDRLAREASTEFRKGDADLWWFCPD